MVRKVVNMFNKSSNTVNLCFVDIRKAFDRANIYGILCKLKQHSIHSRVINVLESWLCNSSVSVKWGDAVSDKISLAAGVRQGSVLSPLLFSVYVDCILDKLDKSGFGCYLGKRCYNSFMYADDLVLLSISVSDLQNLINVCADVLTDLDLTINFVKCQCIRI